MTEAEDTRTVGDLAREALQVQDASNFTAVANGFGRAMKRLRKLLPNYGDLRDHPIGILWASKIESMTHHHLEGSLLPVLIAVETLTKETE